MVKLNILYLGLSPKLVGGSEIN